MIRLCRTPAVLPIVFLFSGTWTPSDASCTSSAFCLNEILRGSPDLIEIYGPPNTSVSCLAIEIWVDDELICTYSDFPGSTDDEGYACLELDPPCISPIGGEIALIDVMSGQHLEDHVAFGNQGGAPAPGAAGSLNTCSLARCPDASTLSSCNQSATEFASYWTLSCPPTFCGINDVCEESALGGPVVMNEVSSSSAKDRASLELFNTSSGFAADGRIDGWFLSTGFGLQTLSGTIPSLGYLAVEIDDALDFTRAERIDLFTSSGVRVFQLGIAGSNPEDDCFRACPDGAIPPDGWDFTSSGGRTLFFPGECSFGSGNRCAPSGMSSDHVSDRYRFGTWGDVKRTYRP